PERGLRHRVGARLVAAAERDVDAHPLDARGEARDRTEEALEGRPRGSAVARAVDGRDRPGGGGKDRGPPADPRRPQPLQAPPPAATRAPARAQPAAPGPANPAAGSASPPAARSAPPANALGPSASGTRPIPAIRIASQRSAPGTQRGLVPPSQAGIQAAR